MYRATTTAPAAALPGARAAAELGARPAAAANPYRVQVVESIDEIAPEIWDSVLETGDLLHSHRFLRAVELSQVEDARYRYLTFYRNGELVATAVLSAFTINLGLFLGEGARRYVEAIRRVFKRFLKMQVLVCGIPVSLGQRNLVITADAHYEPVAHLLAQTMAEVAQTEGISYTCMKEMALEEIEALAAVRDHGFFCGRSLPYMVMDLPWSSFDDYMSSLRHTYRRKIRRSLRKLGTKKPVVHEVKSDTLPTARGIYRVGPQHVSAGLFHRLYLKVMARAETRLETLNEAFFLHIQEQMGEDLELLAVVDSGSVESVAMLARDGETLFFLLVGQDSYSNEVTDPYFNILYAILQRAFETGCTKVRLGQTSYWSKQQIGAEPEELYLYFRARQPWINAVLRAARATLFPHTPLGCPRVFKEEETA